MAVPLDLLHIHSGFLSANAFNANNALIEEALLNTIDRRGGLDNAMEADFDMGMYNIFNLKRAYLGHQAVPFNQLVDFIKGSSTELTSLVDMEDRIYATAGQTDIVLQQITYIPTTNSLMVFVDGVYQRAGLEYMETSNKTLSFVTPLTAGQEVDIFGSRYDAEQFVGLAIEAANSAQQDAADAAQSASDAQDAADLAAWAAGYKFDINNQTGITYTLVADDAGDFVRMNNDLENSVVVPLNGVTPFEIGTIILIRQVGDGKTTVVPTAGVTVNSPYASLFISAADFGVALVKVDTDEWDMVKAFGGVDTDDLEAFTGEFDARIDDLFKELLSSNPTFVVNFKSLQDALQREIDELIARIDGIEEGEGSGNPLEVRVSDLETRVQNVEAAIDAITGGGSAGPEGSAAPNGYADFPANGSSTMTNGLSFRWGSISPTLISNGAEYPVTFSEPFAGDCFQVILGSVVGYSRGGENLSMTVTAQTKSGFTIYNEWNGYESSEGVQDNPIRWFAIGV